MKDGCLWTETTGCSWGRLTLGHPGVARGNSRNFKKSRIQARILEISLSGPELVIILGPVLGGLFSFTLRHGEEKNWWLDKPSSVWGMSLFMFNSLWLQTPIFPCLFSSTCCDPLSLSASHNTSRHHLMSVVYGVWKIIRKSFLATVSLPSLTKWSSCGSCSRIFSVKWFETAKPEAAAPCPSAGEWIDKSGYIHAWRKMNSYLEQHRWISQAQYWAKEVTLKIPDCISPFMNIFQRWAKGKCDVRN